MDRFYRAVQIASVCLLLFIVLAVLIVLAAGGSITFDAF